MASPLLLSVHDAYVTFGVKPLFEDLSFNIHQGDKICLVGKNGSGKTTLMHKNQGADDKAIAMFCKMVEENAEIDAVLYSSVIEIAVKKDDVVQIDAIFAQGVDNSPRGKDRFAIANAYVDVIFSLYQGGKLEEDFEQKCRGVYEAYIASFYREVGLVIDCHGLSPGAFALLLIMLEKEKRICSVGFNIGKETHSTGPKERRLSAVLDTLQRLQYLQGVSSYRSDRGFLMFR